MPCPRRRHGLISLRSIPARNEAGLRSHASLASLLRQDYPGRFSVMLVDDNSDDATAAIARAAARADRLDGAADDPAGKPLPERLDRKALGGAAGHRGCEPRAPDFLLLTDADIVYEPRALRTLARARQSVRRLRSDLADGEAALRELRRASFIPAFVYLLPDALPVLLGERSAQHAWPRRPAAAC